MSTQKKEMLTKTQSRKRDRDDLYISEKECESNNMNYDHDEKRGMPTLNDLPADIFNEFIIPYLDVPDRISLFQSSKRIQQRFLRPHDLKMSMPSRVHIEDIKCQQGHRETSQKEETSMSSSSSSMSSSSSSMSSTSPSMSSSCAQSLGNGSNAFNDGDEIRESKQEAEKKKYKKKSGGYPKLTTNPLTEDMLRPEMISLFKRLPMTLSLTFKFTIYNDDVPRFLRETQMFFSKDMQSSEMKRHFSEIQITNEPQCSSLFGDDRDPPMQEVEKKNMYRQIPFEAFAMCSPKLYLNGYVSHLTHEEIQSLSQLSTLESLALRSIDDYIDNDTIYDASPRNYNGGIEFKDITFPYLKELEIAYRCMSFQDLFNYPMHQVFPKLLCLSLVCMDFGRSLVWRDHVGKVIAGPNFINESMQHALLHQEDPSIYLDYMPNLRCLNIVNVELNETISKHLRFLFPTLDRIYLIGHVNDTKGRAEIDANHLTHLTTVMIDRYDIFDAHVLFNCFIKNLFLNNVDEAFIQMPETSTLEFLFLRDIVFDDDVISFQISMPNLKFLIMSHIYTYVYDYSQYIFEERALHDGHTFDDSTKFHVIPDYDLRAMPNLKYALLSTHMNEFNHRILVKDKRVLLRTSPRATRPMTVLLDKNINIGNKVDDCGHVDMIHEHSVQYDEQQERHMERHMCIRARYKEIAYFPIQFSSIPPMLKNIVRKFIFHDQF